MENVKILRANRIGGCVTIIMAQVNGEIHRIMIDYGCSLEADPVDVVNYPWEEEPVDAVFFTHYHGDHIGRLNEIPKNVPIYMGETAREVMLNIKSALSKIEDEEEAKKHQRDLELLKDDERIHTFSFNGKTYDAVVLPGFRVEPYSVDHSAYDAYMFLVEADTEEGTKVILHTGDFRGHGRRGKAMLGVIHKYIRKRAYNPKTRKYDGDAARDVDILITEGTMMNRDKEEVLTEFQLQLEAAKYLKKHRYAFLVISSTNLDSLASFYQGAQMAASPFGRYMYTYSDYFAVQLKTFSDTAGKFAEVYQFRNVYTLRPDKPLKSEKWTRTMTQKELMERTGFIAVIKPIQKHEHYIDMLMEDYKAGKISEKPVIIYSMWDGYVEEDNPARKEEWIRFFKRQEERYGIKVKHLHTSGHATIDMIEKVILATSPKEAIMPMHTENAEKFKKLNIGDELIRKITITKE